MFCVRQKILPALGKFVSGHLKTQVKRTFTSKEIKRFYKNVTITVADGGGFEINLDRRKLRTPMGTVFRVPNEPLAISVANEWEAQKEMIQRHTMYMTALCNTAIDETTGRDKDTLVKSVLEFLDTDTVCYWLSEPNDLAELQKFEWGSLLEWVQKRYDVEINATTGIGIPNIPEKTYQTFQTHLHSYNDWALIGYWQAVETLKSVVIATAVIDRHLEVEKAVALARLEQEFQASKWGVVEWSHDIELMALRSRLAAASLFIDLNSSDRTIKVKNEFAR